MKISARGAQKHTAGSLTYTKRGLVVLCVWLLWGDFCFTLMEAIVPTIVPLKFKALGASNTVIGLFITTVPGIINIIGSPVISFRSDRFRSRWGRRIPFILATLPLLVASLAGLGFSEVVASWLHGHLPSQVGSMSVNTVAIGVLGAMMVLFAIFNAFVNSVFWYLFNDVVPEALLGRFMSWFRLVSLAATSLYSLVIFPHASTYTTEIFVGAGVLYGVGVGLMCLKVREGEYAPPPPNVDGRSGLVAAIKTYVQECLGLKHYWFLFMASMGVRVFWVTTLFNVFLYQSLGLSLQSVGVILFAYRLSSAVAIPVSGWLADRFHPIRIVIAGALLQAAVLPPSLIWLFWHPTADTAFYVLLGANILFFGPIEALVSVMDPPLFMRIFPRDRYGQFCSANGMLRSGAEILAGVSVGLLLDLAAQRWSMDVAYRGLPLVGLAAYALVLFAMFRLYRSWRRYGGDTGYVAPLPAPRTTVAPEQAVYTH